MTKIKLKEWADRHNLSYLTANRHFHAGMIPGAVQLDSGTILVEDDSPEQLMAATSNNDAMSLFLKKTVEFSKNNSTVEDFAAYVISNFQLKLNASPDSPKYSKNKPKSEEVQKHFQKFMQDKDSVDHLRAVKTLIKEGKNAGDVIPADQAEQTAQAAELADVLGNSGPFARVQDVEDSFDEDVADFGFSLSTASLSDDNDDSPTIGGLVTRSVDLNTTPQQINYTGSTNQTSDISSLVANNSSIPWGPTSVNAISDDSVIAWGPASSTYVATNSAFQPTQKELQSVNSVIRSMNSENNLPRKRGRKPSKKR